MKLQIHLFQFLLLTLSLLGTRFTSFAQAGYSVDRKNLNALTEENTQKFAELCDKRELEFEIDSLSKFSNVELLANFEHLTLIFDTYRIPDEFQQVRFTKLKSAQFFFDKKVEDLAGLGTLNCPKITQLELHFQKEVENVNEIGKLTQLKELALLEYRNEKLPNNLNDLTQLTSLTIRAEKVKRLTVMDQLKKLERLLITCPTLESLGPFPENSAIFQLNLVVGPQFHSSAGIEQLPHLKWLSVFGTSWEVIPGNWSKQLEQIHLINLPKLQDVTQLKSYSNLQSIAIMQTGLRTFDLDMSGLKNLNQLTIDHNEFLTEISGLGTLQTIEKFKLSQLPNLRRIDFDLSRTKFKTLTLEKLPNLRSIEGIGTCSSLENLTLIETGLPNLPQSMYQLTALKSLHIERCNQLESIDALVNMPSLNQFSLYECNALTAIPPLFNTNLDMKDVRFEFMRSLAHLDGLAGLPKLNSIFLRALHEDVSFPSDLSRSASITWICIETPIKDLSPIHDLLELKHLRIMYSMDTLPESLFTNKNLEKLEIYQSRITDASPLERLEFLKDLRLKHNKQLKVLPDLKKFKHLETSDIRMN